MASQEVTLRAGESITLHLETAGRTYRLNLSLTEHGVSVTAPAEAKVEVHESAMAGSQRAAYAMNRRDQCRKLNLRNLLLSPQQWSVPTDDFRTDEE